MTGDFRRSIEAGAGPTSRRQSRRPSSLSTEVEESSDWKVAKQCAALTAHGGRLLTELNDIASRVKRPGQTYYTESRAQPEASASSQLYSSPFEPPRTSQATEGRLRGRSADSRSHWRHRKRSDRARQDLRTAELSPRRARPSIANRVPLELHAPVRRFLHAMLQFLQVGSRFPPG